MMTFWSTAMMMTAAAARVQVRVWTASDITRQRALRMIVIAVLDDGEKMALMMVKLPAALQLLARALQTEEIIPREPEPMGCPFLLGLSMGVGEKGYQPRIQVQMMPMAGPARYRAGPAPCRLIPESDQAQFKAWEAGGCKAWEIGGLNFLYSLGIQWRPGGNR